MYKEGRTISSMSMKRPYLSGVMALGVSLAIVFLVAALGGAVTASSVHDWYPTLAKPVWTPPAWVFGPAWSTLYLLMAIASWLVWQRRGETLVGPALRWYGVQLVLNAMWSILFFGLRSPGVAMMEILFLWCAILATVVTFHRVRPLAAWLLVPYLLWSTFAAALNGAVWWLNRA